MVQSNWWSPSTPIATTGPRGARYLCRSLKTSACGLPYIPAQTKQNKYISDVSIYRCFVILICTYIFLTTYIYVHIYYIYVDKYIYSYIYMYIYTDTYIYIYTYMEWVGFLLAQLWNKPMREHMYPPLSRESSIPTPALRQKLRMGQTSTIDYD